MSLNNCNCFFFFLKDGSDGDKRWSKEWLDLPALLLNVVACFPLEEERIAPLDSDNELCKLQSLSSSPFLNRASSSPKSPCRRAAAYWKPPEQPPATRMHAPEACTFSCTHWAPRSWLQAWLGKHKTPRNVSGHEVKQISLACPKDQLKRGQWENSVPSLVLSFLPRQTREPEKN